MVEAQDHQASARGVERWSSRCKRYTARSRTAGGYRAHGEVLLAAPRCAISRAKFHGRELTSALAMSQGDLVRAPAWPPAHRKTCATSPFRKRRHVADEESQAIATEPKECLARRRLTPTLIEVLVGMDTFPRRGLTVVGRSSLGSLGPLTRRRVRPSRGSPTLPAQATRGRLNFPRHPPEAEAESPRRR